MLLDLEGDGDLDIVTNDFHSEPMVLVSDLAERHAGLRYLFVELLGSRSNRDGLGARVRVVTDRVTYTKVHDGKSGYLSQSRLPLHFGLGRTDLILRIEVRWPSGTEQVMSGPVEVNRRVVIREPGAGS